MQRTVSYQKCYPRIIHSYILLSYNSLLIRHFLGQFQALVTWITVITMATKTLETRGYILIDRVIT